MSDKSPDRRVQRSLRALWQALFSLLHRHDWDAISVQMICDAADVGRSTFYSHYPTKQALLEAGFARELIGIRDDILTQARLVDASRLATAEWLAAHLMESRPMLRRVRGTTAGLLILDRFRQALRQVLAEELALRGMVPSETQLAFATAGLFACLDEGISRGELPSALAHEVAGMILSLM